MAADSIPDLTPAQQREVERTLLLAYRAGWNDRGKAKYRTVTHRWREWGSNRNAVDCPVDGPCGDCGEDKAAHPVDRHLPKWMASLHLDLNEARHGW